MTKSSKHIAIAAAVGATFGMIDSVAEHAAVERTASEGAVLDSLLADLEVPGDAVILEDGPVGTTDIGAAGAGVGEEHVESIEEDADAIAARQRVYDAQGGGAEFIEGAPETTPEAVAGTETPEQIKARKAQEKADKKAAAKKVRDEKAAAKAAAKAAEPPKAPRATSVTHKPGDLLVAKLGANWRELVVFTDAQAADTLVLEAAQDEFVARMNDGKSIADKVTEKIAMLFTWLSKGGELNEVMRRAFTVLHTTGELTSGDKGNLQLNLLTKPYSMGTARSQANQMFMAFPELALTVKEKGKMVPNPNSVLLPMVYAKLGLTS